MPFRLHMLFSSQWFLVDFPSWIDIKFAPSLVVRHSILLLRHIPSKHCPTCQSWVGFRRVFPVKLRPAEKKNAGIWKEPDIFESDVASFMIQMSVVSFEKSLGMTATCTYVAPDMKICLILWIRPTNIWPAIRSKTHLPQILTLCQFRFLTLYLI